MLQPNIPRKKLLGKNTKTAVDFQIISPQFDKHTLAVNDRPNSVYH